jgi:hypothetical protein
VPHLGAVVALFAADQLIVHRVVAIRRGTTGLDVIIAGDSSPGSHARMPVSELVGEIESVSRGPAVINAWLSPPLGVLAVYAGYGLRFLVRLKSTISRSGAAATGTNR